MSKENVPTPHNAAKYDEIAETVIMSGDPLRAKFMAENFLENPVQFNGVRGMLGYTGTYKGKRVSVMGHGMGIPSIAIYTYELFNFYDVKNIIRVGTAGCIQPEMKLGDLVIAQGACTNSAYIDQYKLPGTYAPIADFGLLSKAVKACEEFGYGYKVGNVMSADNFYDEDQDWKAWQRMGVYAIEMEASALYTNAARAGKHALAILTVSDSIVDGTATSAEERQKSFTRMMDVAFSLA
ncbi:MAG: purine-nucleoside phosphorylase [Bacteroidaceae bacterium]|nr:purine-nucleoside phosphorylase [Bacteroidaceae bacterium]